jgi:hypothetical protein
MQPVQQGAGGVALLLRGGGAALLVEPQSWQAQPYCDVGGCDVPHAGPEAGSLAAQCVRGAAWLRCTEPKS